MSINRAVLQSPQFLFIESILALSSIGLLILLPAMWVATLVVIGAVSVAVYVILEQQQIIANLQQQVDHHRIHEDEFALRTEQLRRTLHDIRSPMSALKLRIQILKKHDADQRQIEYLERSVERAIDQIQMMSDIQKGQVEPTDTMQMKMSDIRKYLAETLN